VTIQLWQEPDEDPNYADEMRKQVRRRQALTIIFAIVLISIAGITSAQSPQADRTDASKVPIHYEAATDTPVAHPAAVIDRDRVTGGAPPIHRVKVDARPTYVDMTASLSNFDSDPEPDGWRADVVVRDRMDRPVVVRANATFELMPRVSTADHQRFVNGSKDPIRWSMPLTFDQDSVARVRLPLRQTLQPMLGWSSAIYPPSGMRWRNVGRNVSGLHASSRRTAMTSDLRNLIGTPSSGELRVRVSVPTQGVFEAVTPVWIRPSVLVDTQWPYR
jgi:hypothetical protein